MGRIFTHFFVFLLLSIVTLFPSGLQAQGAASVKLYASSEDACYNVQNSYTSTISAKDFIQVRSFRLTLNFDKSEFAFEAVSDVNPLFGGVVNATVDNSDPVKGIVRFEWTSDSEVTIADASLFKANFKVLSSPNAEEGNNLFDSPLAWDAANTSFFSASNWAGSSYSVETTNGELNVPGALLEIASFTNILSPTVPGGTDGRVTINATGGAGSYMYSTDNFKWYFSNVLALPEGSTTIYVKDAYGCITSDVVTIDPITVGNFTAAATGLIACQGDNTSEGIAISGLTWQSGRTIQYFVSESSSTVYTSGTKFIPASVNGVLPTLPAVSTKFGAGTYYVGARDQYGLTSEVKTVTLEENPALVLESVVPSDATCATLLDGTLTINTKGGNGIPKYAIVNNPYAIPYLTDGDFQDMGTYNATTKIGKQVVQVGKGSYYVVVRDLCNTGNSVSGGPYVIASYNPITLDEVAHPVVKTDITCNNANDGTITVSGAKGGMAEYDGTSGYVYKLYTSANVFKATNTTGSFTGLVEGSYYVKITDASNCPYYKTSTVQIIEPVQVDFALTATDALCFGSATGTITASGVISDAGAPYSIAVVGTDAAGSEVNINKTGLAADAVIATGIPASETKHLEPTPAHTSHNEYTVTVTDKNGCTNSHSVVVWQNPGLSVQVVRANGAFVCENDINGEIQAIATGGSGTYTYRLSKDGVAQGDWVAISTFMVSADHTWKVEVKDENGCIASDEEIISLPVGYTVSFNEINCYSDAKATVVVSASGEAGQTFELRYRLNTAVDFTPWAALTAQTTLNDLVFSQDYVFEVKDNKGCITQITKNFAPIQNPLNFTAAPGNELSSVVTITGGTSPYAYKIGSDALVNLPAGSTTFQVSNLKVAGIPVTVYDAHGCLFTKSVAANPITVTAVPGSGNNMNKTFDVKLTFNRAVTVAAGNITGGTYTPGTGTSFTVAMSGNDLATLNLVLGNSIADASGNKFDGATFVYKVGDNTAPTVVVTDPVSPVKTSFTVGLKFNEPVSGVANAVTVTGGKLISVTGFGSDYVLTISSNELTSVSIVLSNAIKDVSPKANPFAGKTLVYKTGEFTAPVLVSKTPSNDVVISDNRPLLKMTFNEDVIPGAGGNLKIYKIASTTAVLDVPITAAMISGKVVTVTYIHGLDINTRYYVKVDGSALTDKAGNKFIGVNDASSWTFKTGTVFATGIEDLESGEFKVYPNPFDDVINLGSPAQLSKVVITNIAGQVVKEVVNPDKTIQLNELHSGIYIISLYDMDNVIAKTAKIVKR